MRSLLARSNAHVHMRMLTRARLRMFILQTQCRTRASKAGWKSDVHGERACRMAPTDCPPCCRGPILLLLENDCFFSKPHMRLSVCMRPNQRHAALSVCPQSACCIHVFTYLLVYVPMCSRTYAPIILRVNASAVIMPLSQSRLAKPVSFISCLPAPMRKKQKALTRMHARTGSRGYAAILCWSAACQQLGCAGRLS